MGATIGRLAGKAPSDRPALKPYWGKPAVRNFRGGDGNVGIIRSPVRAIALPDKITVSSSASAYTSHCWGASRSSGCFGDDPLFVCLGMLNVRSIAFLNTFNRFVTASRVIVVGLSRTQSLNPARHLA